MSKDMLGTQVVQNAGMKVNIMKKEFVFQIKQEKKELIMNFFFKSDENYHLGASALDEIPLLGLVVSCCAIILFAFNLLRCC